MDSTSAHTISPHDTTAPGAPPITPDKAVVITSDGSAMDSAIDSTSAHTMSSPETADPPPITLPGAADATPSNALLSNDVVMSDVGSGSSPQLKDLDDGILPQWFTPIFDYLRGVAQDTAWQELVTEFLIFEKSGPAIGVSLFSFFYSRMKLTV
jgi:hypothetical protein